MNRLLILLVFLSSCASAPRKVSYDTAYRRCLRKTSVTDGAFAALSQGNFQAGYKLDKCIRQTMR
jgi:hypothetical protein